MNKQILLSVANFSVFVFFWTMIFCGHFCWAQTEDLASEFSVPQLPEVKQKIQLQGAGSFYMESHSLPTSKREQTELDFNEFHLRSELTLHPQVSVTVHPEITRLNKDSAATKNNDQQIRFRTLRMNRKWNDLGLVVSLGLLESDVTENLFNQYGSKRWLNPQLRPVAERYRLVNDSDLGIRFQHLAETWSVDFSYTNGEGQGPETGSHKTTQLRVSWSPWEEFHLGGFYLIGGDETYISEISKIEVYEIDASLEWGPLVVTGNILKALSPADRWTAMKAWNAVDLLAFANKSVKGTLSEFEIAAELGRLVPFIRSTQGQPVDGNDDYSFRQQFYGIAYDLGPEENLGVYTYRLHLNDRHSLQSKDQDGYGVSYGLFF